MELGTAVALVAFADQCLKYGNKFVKRCQSYLHAEEEAVELLISIESNWVKIETQIEIVKRIAAGLSKKLQDMQCHVLSQLEGKLKTAIVMIEQLRSEKRENKVAKMDKRKHDDMDITIMMAGLQGMKTSKKVKYVTKKNALYEIVHEIEKWQARYDPTWILIMQMSIGSIDEELHKEQKRPEHEQIPIIVAARGIRDAARATQDEKLVGRGPIWIDQIDLSPLRILHSPVQCSTVDDEKKTILIDTMVTDPAADPDRTAQAVRNLARILSEVDPSVFGLLKCRGVIKDAIENAAWSPCPNFHFIFEVPPDHTNPQSLRSLLLSGTSYPLDERLELAKRLTSSILFVHTVQFVHKNIRPETIIVFQNQHSCIGAPFLAGFEQFRVVDGHSGRVGDDQWQRNLYRHPSRQGTNPQQFYGMQHDIFSLGVVLLEIGLWTSFVLYHSEDESTSPIPNNIFDKEIVLASASQIKLQLEDLAANELPGRLGRRYTEIVLLCLRCLDRGTGVDGNGKGFGVDAADWIDEDGIAIGIRYIENVLMNMQEIVM